MKKLIYVTIGLIIVFAVYKMFFSESPSTGVIINNTLYASNQGINESETLSVGEAEIYIDASGSMKGYFLSDNPGFINTISSLMSIADSSKVYFMGNPKVYAGLTKDIVQNLRRQPNNTATTFAHSFEQMCRQSGGSKVCFLVTDGIMSVGNKTGLALKDLQNAIEKTLKANGAGKSVAVLRYTGEFLSNPAKSIYYYDCNDKRHVLNCDNRPYFVIIVGEKDVLRYIRSVAAAKLQPAQAVYFGVHDMAGHQNNTCITTSDTINEARLEIPGAPIVLNATLPACFAHFDAGYVKTNLTVSINGVTIGKQYESESNTRISNQELNIVLDQTKNIIAPAFDGKVTIKLTVANPMPAQWQAYSSDDDTQIENEGANTTFGLSTLLQGIKNSMDAEPTLIEFTYIFTL